MSGQVREATSARATERMVSWFRIVGGLVGIVLTVTDQVVHPALERNLEVVSLAALALVGVVSLRWLRRERDWSALRRHMRWTFTADALLLLAQMPLHAFVELEAPSPALLVPLLGAVRFGWFGASIGTVGVALASVVRGVVAVRLYDLPPGIDAAVVTTLLAGIVGFITAHLYATARAGRAEADDAAAAARAAQARAEEATARAEAAHRVLTDGVGGSVGEVVRRLADTVHDVTEAGGVRISVVTDGGGASVVVTRGDPDRGRRTEHPVTVGGTVLGSLVATDVVRMEADLPEFARQVGLAVHAARLLDQEAALAARHRALDLMRADFVALTSHELRTPVAAIIGAAETLLEHADALGPEGARELHELLHRQGRRLEGLVEDLVIVGRTEAGTLDYQPAYVELASLVDEALAELQLAPSVDGDPDVRVWLDPDRGRQVLLNLVHNAFDHGQEPVTVRWVVEADRELVRVAVVDAGPGIPTELHDTVFERFVQLSPITHHSSGTGLGLGISRDLTRAMGGDVWIDAAAPTTTFVAELPLHPTGASVGV